MKKIFVALLSLFASVAFSATLSPITLLNPSGSSSGQAIISTGASSAPAWGGVGLNGISAIAANTVIANATSSSANPTAFAMPSCSTSSSALEWTTNTGFTCGTVATSGANSNITSLSGLTTPLSVPQGGTNLATIPQYNVLAGNGTSSISAIVPSTSGFVLTSNGASAFPTFQAIPSQAGRLIGVQVFTSTGTYTPDAGTNSVIVEDQAPGGGGGGVSATGAGQVAIAQGGSGGSYAKVRITSGFSGVSVTIGSVGSGGAAGANNGTAGGTTSFGAIVSCPGGNGGVGSAALSPSVTQSGANAPANCTISGATVLDNIAGATSSVVTNVSSAAAYIVRGGFAHLGFNANGGNGSGGDGAAIPASTSAAAGQNGVGGEVIVYEYN